ncbi:Sphingolipid delta(4)-desaturase DES1-like [Vitis vinifera]|uniref:Sphingolipid delta(4)-desaturase DES1-like n=1 Tax=Vitis vinifera TaxID=29760 RepID=A0A438DR34_VITVI|nr:Sphingolipid delta(4)-desaturase DES1-like [Vitis vinifera]
MRRDAGRGLHAHVHQRRTQQVSQVLESVAVGRQHKKRGRKSREEGRGRTGDGRGRERGGSDGKTTSSGRTQTSLTPPDAVRYSLSTLKSKTSSALTLSLSSRCLTGFVTGLLFNCYYNEYSAIKMSLVHTIEIVGLQVAGVVLLQLGTATVLHDAGWLKILTVAYFFGSFLNHNLFLAIHELSHNLAFSTPVYNRWLGIFANLPIGVPMSVTFQKVPP